MSLVPARAVAVAVAVEVAALACTGPLSPVPLSARKDRCAQCGMVVAAPSFAAQLVGGGLEPRFFDDLACLRDWLRAHPERPRGVVAFVADHRTGTWVRAGAAAYARVPGLATPMASGLVAHRDAASRLADRALGRAIPVSAEELFGASGLPDGKP